MSEVDGTELTADDLWKLLSTARLGVLATIKKDGRPQLSNIGYEWDPQSGTARIIAGDFRAKTHNLRRDPRASLHVTGSDFRLWLVAEGVAELSPICHDLDDEVGREILQMFGQDSLPRDSPEFIEYIEKYPIVGRLIVRLRVQRLYGGEASKSLGVTATLEEAL